MGSSSSKSGGDASASSSSSGVQRTRSKGSRVFQYSCLGSPAIDNDNDRQSKEYGGNGPCTNETDTESNQVKTEGYRKVKVEESDEMVSTDVELDEWGQASLANAVSRADSGSSRASSTQSLNPPNGFLSRCGFFSGNVSFRLSRTTSIGSTRQPVSSTSFSISNNEEEHLHTGAVSGLVSRNEARQGNDMLPACLINRPPTPYNEGTSGSLQVNPPASEFFDNYRDDRIISTQEVVRDNSYTSIGYDININSPRNCTEVESIETRLADRRIGAREPVERNFRFSRTLSVGRLRDRVLRRSSFSDLSCPLQQEREVRGARHGNGRRAWGGETGGSASNRNPLISPTSSHLDLSSMSSSLYSSQDYDMETTRSREARYHDLLEHRSNFLERRRRIRSQVRALQRLGSRFENLSGHERSCILSGQHRTGRCTCHINTRDANPNDDTSARASISRIVMLAEALFEVLDEIHQQSVVLSSRPSVSSIGSVPAPTEVVESLPVKLYTKVPKYLNEDAAQCYICLVEYEEGDSLRILPCHHEFHRICIDKWLKEIHRVCPLCRGDICRADSSCAEN
ncbi:E3 ubiquitin-protein ligase MBR1 [Malania oleifera]|uniref:E3 ubiquitin-protein ligase MBR1 n=1 Tax=Malania oleifera TaxID=397392 RepID=UPI0025AE3F9B|nr:E3 ubiquitin-protein ligase MBR1 [Malania oleifera]XP_057965733.1 E3 ubiquitin-protein ligase MBR1 [Malania oleifera]